MAVKFSISNNNTQSSLIVFLKKYNGFVFCPLGDFLNFEGDKFIAIDNKDKEENINFLSKKVRGGKNYKTIFFLPTRYNKIFLPENITPLSYPIPFKAFIKKINIFFEYHLLKYKNLSIVDNNFLLNSENNQKIYLTEIELKILCCFFKKITIEKNLIKTDILNLQKNIIWS